MITVSYFFMIGWLTACFRGMWENPARCGKSGGRAKNQFQGTSVCYPGNLGAEVEMEYNCMFSQACNRIQSQKAEKVRNAQVVGKPWESGSSGCRHENNYSPASVPASNPTCRYELPDPQMYTWFVFPANQSHRQVLHRLVY